MSDAKVGITPSGGIGIVASFSEGLLIALRGPGWHTVAYVAGTPFESLRVTVAQADITPHSGIAGSIGNLFNVYLRSWQTVATPLGVVFLWKIHGPQR